MKNYRREFLALQLEFLFFLHFGQHMADESFVSTMITSKLRARYAVGSRSTGSNSARAPSRVGRVIKRAPNVGNWNSPTDVHTKRIARYISAVALESRLEWTERRSIKETSRVLHADRAEPTCQLSITPESFVFELHGQSKLLFILRLRTEVFTAFIDSFVAGFARPEHGRKINNLFVLIFHFY
jgi:hypothetical protein